MANNNIPETPKQNQDQSRNKSEQPSEFNQGKKQQSRQEDLSSGRSDKNA